MPVDPVDRDLFKGPSPVTKLPPDLIYPAPPNDPAPRPVPALQNKDVDLFMWTFHTPTPDTTIGEGAPGRDPWDDLPTTTDKPPSLVPKKTPQRTVNCFLPPWQQGSIWSIPWGAEYVVQQVATCLGWYSTWVSVVNLGVPEGRIVTFTNISYELEQAAVSDGDIFEVRIMRGGIEMMRWEDMVVNNAAADPAERYLFAGHYRPLPVMIRLDRTEHVTVQMRMLGPFPFALGPGTPFNGTAKVLVDGWMDRVRDTRDGAPKVLSDGVFAATPEDFVRQTGRNLRQIRERAHADH